MGWAFRFDSSIMVFQMTYPLFTYRLTSKLGSPQLMVISTTIWLNFCTECSARQLCRKLICCANLSGNVERQRKSSQILSQPSFSRVWTLSMSAQRLRIWFPDRDSNRIPLRGIGEMLAILIKYFITTRPLHTLNYLISSNLESFLACAHPHRIWY